MTPISNILVVDDNAFYRNGIITTLNRFPFIKVKGHFPNGTDCLKALKNVDYLLIDIRIPGLNGLETAKKAIQIKPKTKIIAMIDFIEDTHIEKIFKFRFFSGVLLKSIDSEGMKYALLNIINGKKFYSPELMSVLTERQRNRVC